MRGIAALVVLVHHVLLTDRQLAVPYQSAGPAGKPSYVWWLTYTPLHLIWNGPVAVYVFFVMSGYVLALPAAKAVPADWSGYYPRRLIRLYVPVLCAILLALAWIQIVPRSHVPGGSWWLNAHEAPDPRAIAQDALLLFQPGATNSVLWSLRWEVIFSLLLPFFLLLGWHAARLPYAVTCPLLAGLTVAPLPGAFGEWAAFLPMFACGVSLAFVHEGRPMDGRGLGVIYLAAALVGLNSSWMMYLFMSHPLVVPLALARVVEVISSTAIVALAGRWTRVVAIFGQPSLCWLGSRSFSLYLIHEPVAVSFSLLFGGRPPVILTLLMVIPSSLLIAEIFFRLVEKPSLRLAGSAARKIRSTHRGNGVEIQMPERISHRAGSSSDLSIAPQPVGVVALDSSVFSTSTAATVSLPPSRATGGA